MVSTSPTLKADSRRLLIFFLILSAFGQSVAATQKESSFYNGKLTPGQKRILYPSPEEMAAFAEFLKKRDAGLVRLLPIGKYEFGLTIAADRDPDTVLPIKGGGAFYSFAENRHDLGPWSEISLQYGRLIADFNRETIGLITSLGDVPLESVNRESAGVEFLIRYRPPTTFAEAMAERMRNRGGFRDGDFTYSSSVAATAGSTYVLRSVIYNTELPRDGGDLPAMRKPEEYSGADELIAFRVVRRMEDGGATLLWKRLQKSKVRKLDGSIAHKTAAGVSVHMPIEALTHGEVSLGATVPQVLAFLDSRAVKPVDCSDGKGDVEIPAGATTRFICARIQSGYISKGESQKVSVIFIFNGEGKLTRTRMSPIFL
jgi:hypothetical protein